LREKAHVIDIRVVLAIDVVIRKWIEIGCVNSAVSSIVNVAEDISVIVEIGVT